MEAWWTPGEWSGHLDDLLMDLQRDGLLSPSGRKGFSLTRDGRNRVLAALGVKQLPRELDWAQLQRKHLVARALGASCSDDVLGRISDSKGLTAALIASGHGLASPGTATLAQVRDRLLWRQVGFDSDQAFTLEKVRAALLGRMLESPREQRADGALRQLAAKAVGARRAQPEELRLAAVRRWLARSAEGSSSPEPAITNLDAFAARVLEAARVSTTGRFGPRKVFISHVYRSLRTALGMDEQTFKQRLLEANRARLLSLSRADLVEAMDPADVEASEVRHFNATFHFISL